MILLWNRKEVYMGYSMTECSNIRSTLTANHIKYTYKVFNAASNRGTRGSGSFGISAKFNYMYYIYVHQKDYEQACKLIGESGCLDKR